MSNTIVSLNFRTFNNAKYKIMLRKISLCFLTFLGSISLSMATDWTENFVVGTPEIKSMSQLTFGPEGILFIGDAQNAKVIAIALDDQTQNDSQAGMEEIQDIEGKIAALLGTKAEEILIHDLAVNPISQNIYLAVSRGRGQQDSYWMLPNQLSDANMLLKINREGQMEEVPLTNIKYLEMAIPNPVSTEKKNRFGSLRVDAISDLAYADGKVYVAGLSNEEFASSLRVLPFPFQEEVTASTIEIYHGAHGRYETESPIRTFLPYTMNGESYILASYTCTPLVTIPTQALKDGEHVKGRTVAELGAGNMPLDMVVYQKGGKDYLLIANTTRNLMRVDPAEIANYEGSLSEKVERYGTAGVSYTAIPTLVQQMDKLNDNYVVMLTRLPYGSMSLIAQSTKRL